MILTFSEETLKVLEMVSPLAVSELNKLNRDQLNCCVLALAHLHMWQGEWSPELSRLASSPQWQTLRHYLGIGNAELYAFHKANYSASWADIDDLEEAIDEARKAWAEYEKEQAR